MDCGNENCDNICSEITVTEVEKSVREAKDGKSAGPDEVVNEMMKKLGPISIQTLTSFVVPG